MVNHAAYELIKMRHTKFTDEQLFEYPLRKDGIIIGTADGNGNFQIFESYKKEIMDSLESPIFISSRKRVHLDESGMIENMEYIEYVIIKHSNNDDER